MLAQLTARQQQLFEYLSAAIDRDGRAPSLRQAAADLGISHAAVAQGIRILEEKGYLKRHGHYSRTIHLLNSARQPAALHRSCEVPIIGRVTAGLPMYAQQEWDGTVVLDTGLYKEPHLFALRVKGDSMRDAAILDGDIAICTPRQFAHNGEIVVALVHDEEATVKRFFLRKKRVELRPANPAFKPMFYSFDDVLVQGKVVGVQRVMAS
ncbi:MAG: transcriptional repressor LexA [Desulfatitalea sp.]|nr:transcriptional repressor LexA [Desulfatitalea sp.]NNK00459.1 transcriptional repressor LexA [Desulfatitalea sp.]